MLFHYNKIPQSRNLTEVKNSSQNNISTVHIYTFIDHKTGDINSTEKQPKLPWKSYGTDLFMEYKLLCEKKQLNRKIFHTSRQHKFFLL